MNSEKVNFSFNPNLILTSLGTEAVEKDSIAIAEQIKNSADAKAKNVCVDLSQIENDLISISDDGQGMTSEEIIKKWLNVGYSDKVYQSELSGGKGVGRFSIFRLGSYLEIVSKKNGIKTTFSLDKDELMEADRLNDYQLSINTVNTNQKNGTIVYIKKLKNKINLSEIQTSLTTLILEKNDLNLKIIFPKEFERKEFLTPKDVLPHALFKVEIELDNNKVKKFDFSGYYNRKKIYSFDKKQELQNDINEIPDKYNLDNIYFFLSNFYFDNKKSHLNSKDRDYIRDNFLAAYQGINIYRNNFKIFGHGEVDWIKLAEKRLKSPDKVPDNKLSYGYIVLSHKTDNIIKERTSREGFIEDDHSLYFFNLIETIMDHIGKHRANVLTKIKEYFKTEKKVKYAKDRPSVFQVNKNEGSSRGNKDINTVLSDSKKEENLRKNKNNEDNVCSLKNEEKKEDDSSLVKKNLTSKHNEAKKEKKVEPVIGVSKEENTPSLHRKLTFNKIGDINQDIVDGISSNLYRELVDELFSINAKTYSFATAFLFRSFIEKTIIIFLRKNHNKYPEYFDIYTLDSNNLIKEHNKKNDQLIDFKVTSSIPKFKKFFKEVHNMDRRSIKQLDSLQVVLNNINLAMHWTDKRISYEELRTVWNNTRIFFETLIKESY